MDINKLIAPKPTPNYQAEVLDPLRAAQAAKAKADAEAEQARQKELAREVRTASPVFAQYAGGCPAYHGGFDSWLSAAGIPSDVWGCVEFIVSHEGGWDPCKVNGGAHICDYVQNGGNRAYGLGQALPGSKMAPFGADYQTNPVTQLRWMNAYISGSHGGTWLSNYYFWLNNRWY